MALFDIEVSDEEKALVIAAIKTLNDIPHIRYMSQSMIASAAGIKATKVRAVLAELIKEDAIIQYAATENKKLQRYYYTIEPIPEPDPVQ